VLRRYILAIGIALAMQMAFAGGVGLSPPIHLNSFGNTARTDFQVWAEYHYVNADLDVFDFSSRASTNSRLSEEWGLAIGANWRVYEGLSLTASYRDKTAIIDRSVEPKQIKGGQRTLDLGVQILSPSQKVKLAIGAYRTAFDKIVIDKYQVGEVVVGEDIRLLNPNTLEPLPVGELAMKSQGIHFRAAGQLSADSEVRYGYMYSKVDASSNSVLFRVTDEDFLNAEVKGKKVSDIIHSYRVRLPQNNPWREHLFSIGGAFKFEVSADWNAYAGVDVLYVYREGYEPSADEVEQKYNVIFDFSLVRKFQRNAFLFLRMQAYTNYLNGLEPGAYNRRVAHLFDNPYGYFSVGLSQGF
jgi:hypothetical protein